MGLENLVDKRTINLPTSIVNSLKKEYELNEVDIESFIAIMLEKMIEEHIAKKNSEVFSGEEIKEIEDNLKGLGYI